MVDCDSLAEALQVQNLVAIEAGTWKAYQQGDALPSHMIATVLTVGQAQALYDASEPLLADVRAQAQAAYDANVTFLAIGAPTVAQNTAQVRALTQQNQRLLRAMARLVSRERP